MKTIIITTKMSENCYNRIRENWFENCKSYKVKTDASLARYDLQSNINILRVIETEDFRVCLPTCVNPELGLDDRIEYVLSLVCTIAKYFDVPKDELFILFHSGDLFDIQDAMRKTGPLLFNRIYATPNRLKQLGNIVEEEHLYQFRHDSSISNLLLYSEDKDASYLCQTIIEIMTNEDL